MNSAAENTQKSLGGPIFSHPCGKDQSRIADWYHKCVFHCMKILLNNVFLTVFPLALYESGYSIFLTKTGYCQSSLFSLF